MRSLRVTASALVTCLLLAACEGPPTKPATTPAANPSPASAARTIECVPTEAHQQTEFAPQPGDLVVGSILWPGLRNWATDDPAHHGENGDYKIGAVVRAGKTVTVRGEGLEYGQGWQYSPTPVVTFHACEDVDTAYIGGFHVDGRRCVPLEISEPGKPTTRVTVSFFHGSC